MEHCTSSARFGDISLRRVAVRYSGKGRGDVALRVGSAKNVLEADKAAESQYSVSKFETA
jgi:hypothetical protein